MMDLLTGRKAVELCNSYNRLPTILDQHVAGLSVRDTWTLLGELWEICDNIGDYTDQLDDLLPARAVAEMMTDAERAALAALPKRVTVYRGADRGINEKGFSWSIDPKVAAAFPFLMRYRASNPVLVTAVVSRARIVAVKLGRNEGEVIVPPSWPRIRSIRLLRTPQLPEPAPVSPAVNR